jgi:hypothetical protein
MSKPKEDKPAPEAEDKVLPAPVPDAAPDEDDSPERDVLGTGAVGAVVGGIFGGAGGAALGGALGLTGGALRGGRRKKRLGWY